VISGRYARPKSRLHRRRTKLHRKSKTLLRHQLDEPRREGDLSKNDLEVSPLRADLPIEGKGG
jgi:hypothetical protein